MIIDKIVIFSRIRQENLDKTEIKKENLVMSQNEKMIVVNKNNTLFITTEDIEKKKKLLTWADIFFMISFFLFFGAFFIEMYVVIQFMAGFFAILMIVACFFARRDVLLEKKELNSFITEYFSEKGLESILKEKIKECMMNRVDSTVKEISRLEDAKEYLKAQTLREEMAKDIYEALDRGLINHGSEPNGIFSKLHERRSSN